jgi:hypothetical protein
VESPSQRAEGAFRGASQAVAQGLDEKVRWIFFTSPPPTWEHLCGRAGWLLYDPITKSQHDFELILMN